MLAVLLREQRLTQVLAAAMPIDARSSQAPDVGGTDRDGRRVNKVGANEKKAMLKAARTTMSLREFLK